ncbi:MAG: transporter substrate-binding domain-containing protein [Gammaproteobacteria bacterium]|nr:transporter substrate-binding domain-containing protein [Gammaproteobacteria bacterium]
MKIKKLVLAIALSIAVTFAGIAQNTLSNIIKNGEIRIGMTGNQPPYCMKTNSDKLMGYDVDLATILAESMGVKLKMVEMPFSELMQALQSGKVDAVMSGMTITPARNLNALFAGPYTLSGKSILTKSKVLAEITEAAEANVKKYKITCLKGSTSEDFVRAYMSNTEIIPVENYDMGVAMVINDEADAMVADVPICLVSLLRYQDEGLATLNTPLTIEPIGMALPSDDPQFLNLVENYLSALELSGALQLLDQIWFEDGQWLLNMK